MYNLVYISCPHFGRAIRPVEPGERSVALLRFGIRARSWEFRNGHSSLCSKSLFNKKYRL